MIHQNLKFSDLVNNFCDKHYNDFLNYYKILLITINLSRNSNLLTNFSIEITFH